MNKYRIVQFNNGKYALQQVFHLFWFIPIPLQFRDLNSDINYHHSKDSVYFLRDCVTSDLDLVKKKLISNYDISRVITETKLEKVLK